MLADALLLEALQVGAFTFGCYTIVYMLVKAFKRKSKQDLHGRQLVAPTDLLLRKAYNLRGKSMGFGGCRRCGDTWDWKVSHDTPLDVDGLGAGCSAVFPLCAQCWGDLTPEERLPFYDALVDDWEANDPAAARHDLYRGVYGHEPYYEEQRKLITKAVREGK